ncbi:MAG TPA: PA0069 family radical SAM protein [Rhodocyclaceae bacterium]|jgi:DNA repair photolyase|nr:PA0069 family radical SAM protein [Rhodocyclaceae bacterium]
MDEFDTPPKTVLPPLMRKGRGATLNMVSRYDAQQRERTDDAWWMEDEIPPLKTTQIIDTTKRVINYNDSPDIPFDRTLNPYRGCEHGCIYCYARPTHAYLGFSPGLDFETKIVYKPDAAAVLREELSRPKYVCAPIALGMNTDAWQPTERKLGITRGILETLAECKHPFGTVTKSALILRDLDILSTMARENLCHVAVTITTLDPELARTLEPRAASPARRLEVIRALAAADVPVGVSIAPMIPALNDHELESIMAAAFEAGASNAWYNVLRLPHELSPLFRDWLQTHAPGRAAHVMSLIQQMRGGKDCDSDFATRMRGEGELADVLAQRFRIAVKRLNAKQDSRWPKLDSSRFIKPRKASPQGELF